MSFRWIFTDVKILKKKKFENYHKALWTLKTYPPLSVWESHTLPKGGVWSWEGSAPKIEGKDFKFVGPFADWATSGWSPQKALWVLVFWKTVVFTNGGRGQMWPCQLGCHRTNVCDLCQPGWAAPLDGVVRGGDRRCVVSKVWAWGQLVGAGFWLLLRHLLWWSEVKVAQSCLTLCDPMDYTVHGILPARILEWVAILFSRGSSQPRDRTQVSHIAGGFFTVWVTRKVLCDEGEMNGMYPNYDAWPWRGGCEWWLLERFTAGVGAQEPCMVLRDPRAQPSWRRFLC